MAFVPSQFINERVVELKNKVGTRKVIVSCSGGIDSLVCAIISKRALAESPVFLMLDTGLLREEAAKEATKIFANYGMDLQVWDVHEIFFEALKGKTEPEEKRTVFRDVFYRTLNQAMKSYSADLLVQGTIAADILEAQKGIKTQHNVLAQAGVNPNFYSLKIQEPLKDIYKNQVRQIAKPLNIPQKIYSRQPFPGPGFAARIMGEVVPSKVDKMRIATKIVEEIIKGDKIFQVFPVLFSDKATGIVKGKRVLGDIISIRAVESTDALTATACKPTWNKLEKVRDRIIAEVPGVVKVLYDITSKPPSTIEYI